MIAKSFPVLTAYQLISQPGDRSGVRRGSDKDMRRSHSGQNFELSGIIATQVGYIGRQVGCHLWRDPCTAFDVVCSYSTVIALSLHQDQIQVLLPLSESTYPKTPLQETSKHHLVSSRLISLTCISSSPSSPSSPPSPRVSTPTAS